MLAPGVNYIELLELAASQMNSSIDSSNGLVIIHCLHKLCIAYVHIYIVFQQ